MNMEGISYTDINGIPEFARGLHILLIDHDRLSLTYMASVLEQYTFKVTAIEQASVALSMIRERKNCYELVMANIDMPDIDSFYFQNVLLENHIPVILISSEMNVDKAKTAIKKGASIFLEKPVSLEDLKNVWQHVYRDKVVNSSPMDTLESDWKEEMNTYVSDWEEEIDWKNDQGLDSNSTALVTDPKGNYKYVNTENTCTKESQEQKAFGIKPPAHSAHDTNEISNRIDKRRRVWTPELNFKFYTAISVLGDKKACPKEILRFMDVKSVTRNQVAIHLQKFRKKVRRICRNSTNESNITRKEFKSAKQSSVLYQQRSRTSETSNCAYRTDMNENLKKNESLGLEESNLKVSENIPSMKYMSSEPPSMSQWPHGSPSLTDPLHTKEKEQFSKEVSEERVVLGPQHKSLPSMNYLTSAADSPHISANAFHFPNELAVATQKQNDTPVVSDLISYATEDQYSMEAEGITELLELMPMKTPWDASTCISATPFQIADEPPLVSYEHYYAPAMIEPFGSELPSNLSTEAAGTYELLELVSMKLPRTNSMTHEDAFPHNSDNAFQVPFDYLNMDLEQYSTLGLSGPFGSQYDHKFSAGTTELDLIAKQIASSSANNPEKIPADFNNGSHRLNAIAHDGAPPEIPLNEQQLLYTPALTGPISSQNQNMLLSTGTNELDLLAKQMASGNANKREFVQADFGDGRQILDAGEIPPAIESNERQSLSADLLKELKLFDNAPFAGGNFSDYCQWMEKYLLEDST